MKLNRIISETMLLEASMQQVIDKYRNKTLSAFNVQNLGGVKDDTTGNLLTGTQVKLRLIQAGAKADDPLLQQIANAAQRGYERMSKIPEKEYAQEMEKQRREIGMGIKGAIKRKEKPFFQ